MKIDVKTKSKFKLSVEEVEKLISTYILPNYPYLEYKIATSNISNSIYLTFQYSERIRSIRISDHKINIPIPSLIVTKSTKKSMVVHYIKNQLDILQRLALEKYLNKITDSLTNN